MNEAFTKWDVADDLRSASDLELYFQACIDADEGDGSLIRAALSDIARARGMNNLEQATGLTSAKLSHALAPEGQPAFATILQIIKALDLRLCLRHNQVG